MCALLCKKKFNLKWNKSEGVSNKLMKNDCTTYESKRHECNSS